MIETGSQKPTPNPKDGLITHVPVSDGNAEPPVRFDEPDLPEPAPLPKEVELAPLPEPTKFRKASKLAARTGLAVTLLTTPHGPADKAADALTDPWDVIEGIVDDESLVIQAAGDRLGEILEGLDKNDTTELDRQLTEFRLRYEKEVPTSEEVATTIEALEKVETVDKALEALGAFTGQYGVDVGRLEDTLEHDPETAEFFKGYEISGSQMDEDNLERLIIEAKDIVEFMSIFPKSEFPKLFEARHIHFVNKLHRMGEEVRGIAGGDESSEHILLGTRHGAKGVPEHELGHTMAVTHVKEPGTGLVKATEYYLGRALNFKQQPSLYASIGGGDEAHAEVSQVLFTEGVAHPDRGLAFNSPVNREVVTLLAEMEAVVPGISAQLIDRLGGRDGGNVIESAPEQAVERQIFVASMLLLTARKIRIDRARAKQTS